MPSHSKTTATKKNRGSCLPEDTRVSIRIFTFRHATHLLGPLKSLKGHRFRFGVKNAFQDWFRQQKSLSTTKFTTYQQNQSACLEVVGVFFFIISVVIITCIISIYLRFAFCFSQPGLIPVYKLYVHL